MSVPWPDRASIAHYFSAHYPTSFMPPSSLCIRYLLPPLLLLASCHCLTASLSLPHCPLSSSLPPVTASLPPPPRLLSLPHCWLLLLLLLTTADYCWLLLTPVIASLLTTADSCHCLTADFSKLRKRQWVEIGGRRAVGSPCFFLPPCLHVF